MRCLEPAATEIRIDAREVDQPASRDEELRSPYVTDGELDVGRWANDSVVLALPDAAAVPTRLRGPLRGLRRVAE